MDNSKQSIKKLWQTFGPIINPKISKKHNKNIDKLMISDKLISNTESIANHFNEYFCNIGHKLADKFSKMISNFIINICLKKNNHRLLHYSS